MKTTVNRIIIPLLFLVILPICSAGDEWELIDENDGVSLYTRKVSGHSEAQFRGVCTVNRSLEAVVSVLSDIPSFSKWFYKCIEAKKIPAENSSRLRFLLYVVIDTPWPFYDRDACYQTEVTIDYALEKVVIRSIALKEPVIPLKKTYVRITDSEHQWVLEKLKNDRTRMTFINRTHAAGPLAHYLSNPGMRDTITHSLRNLKKLLEDPQHSIKAAP